MHEKNKNPSPKLLLIGLCLLFVPFLFIRDFYPFMRLGMFAEPVRSSAQTEQFLVIGKYPFKTNTIDGQSFGLHPQTFHYLCRNHHYRGEDSLLLQKVAQSLNDSNLIELTLNKTTPTDTVLISSYVP